MMGCQRGATMPIFIKGGETWTRHVIPDETSVAEPLSSVRYPGSCFHTSFSLRRKLASPQLTIDPC